MFARWISEQDEEGDLAMGLGLPGAQETQKFKPAAAAAATADDGDIVMETKRPTSTVENRRRAAAVLERLRTTEARALPVERKQPELKGTTKEAPGDAVPAVLFVVDASARSTHGDQMRTVDALLDDWPLTACVVSRGSGEMHVVPFNTNLACRACKEPQPLKQRVVVRTGVDVHRTRQQTCAVCGLSLDKWALVEPQMHTDAKAQAERIRLGLRVCLGVPSKAPADDALAWKAALGCLQDLACAVDSGPDKKQRVQKVAVFFTQSEDSSGLLLTMPSLDTDGQLELVPVIVAYTGARSTAHSRLHSATLLCSEIDAIRERIRAATRNCNTAWEIAPSAEDARWIGFKPFAPVLLPPKFGLVACAENKTTPPQYEICDNKELVAAVREAYQRDPLFDSADDAVDYAIVDKLKTAFAVAQLAAADGSSEAGRSKEADAEGEQRGGKRRRL